MASTPGAFLVPTLDIDLAWHTHQLMANNVSYLAVFYPLVHPPQYSKDTLKYIGRFIDRGKIKLIIEDRLQARKLTLKADDKKNLSTLSVGSSSLSKAKRPKQTFTREGFLQLRE